MRTVPDFSDFLFTAFAFFIFCQILFVKDKGPKSMSSHPFRVHDFSSNLEII